MAERNTDKKSYSHYKWSSISGVKWSGAAELISRIFQFIVTIILARLLQPEEFGMITLALIFVKLIQLIIDFGISSALIQRKEIIENHFRSSFTFLVIFSIVSATILYIFAYQLADLLGNKNISGLIRVLAFSLPLFSMTVIPRVILMRDFKFKHIAISETASTVSYGVVVVIFALIFKNVWCFVAGVFVELFVIIISLEYFSKWRPKLLLSWRSFSEIFTFSSTVFGIRLVNFININLINILISRFFGSTVLGYYSLAYQIIDLPTQRIAKMIMKVMYPVLSKLQDDLKEFSNLFLNYIFIIFLVTAPIYISLVYVAKPFVLVFYGPKWEATIVMLQILCLAGILRCLWTGISVVSLALGKPKFELQLNLMTIATLAPLIYYLSTWGPHVVLSGFSLVLLIFTIVGYKKITSWMEISASSFFSKNKAPVIASLVTGIVGLLLNYLNFFDVENNFINLFLTTSILALTYLLIIYFYDRYIIKGLINMIFQNKSAD